MTAQYIVACWLTSLVAEMVVCDMNLLNSTAKQLLGSSQHRVQKYSLVTNISVYSSVYGKAHAGYIENQLRGLC